MDLYDVVIIGGGPAGMVSAISAKKLGAEKICIFEREDRLGGMLNEHIHNGFGVKTFGVELTGTECIERLVEKVKNSGIEYKINSTVLKFTKEKEITYVNETEGLCNIRAKAIILAMGCREQTIGSINIPRNKCAGIYTCGIAHKFINLDGFLPGKNIIIFGSSNLALLTARRLKIEGANVKMVVEKNLKAIGDESYVKECLEDFNIPFKAGHSIVNIKGKDRIEGVTLAEIDENKKVLSHTEEFIKCDTLLLSVQLFPETDIIRKVGINLKGVWDGPVVDENMCTNIEGIFACGNLLDISYNTDYVVEKATKAGEAAAKIVLASNNIS